MLGGGHESKWVALDDADYVDCAAWPLRKGDLQVKKVAFAGTQPRGLVAAAVDRRGRSIHLYAPFGADVNLDGDRVRTLELGRRTHLIGGARIKGGSYAAVIKPGSKADVFELRRLPKNVVSVSHDLPFKGVSEGWVKQVNGELWLTLKRGDGTMHVGRAWQTTEGSWKLKVFEKPVFDEVPNVVPRGAGEPPVLVSRTRGKGFAVHSWKSEGKSLARSEIDISTEDVESWQAGWDQGALFLALVKGNSLIGQSDLIVHRLSFDGMTTESRQVGKISLNDIHVTEPTFQRRAGGLRLFLINWVDEESTIARYQVSADGVQPLGYSGVFPKGSRIIDEAVRERRGFFALRHRKKLTWGFRLCEL